MTADQRLAGLAWTEINSAAPRRKEENGCMDAFLGKARSLFSEVKRMECRLQSSHCSSSQLLGRLSGRVMKHVERQLPRRREPAAANTDCGRIEDSLRIVGARNLRHFEVLHEAVMDFVHRHQRRLNRHVERGDSEGHSDFLHIRWWSRHSCFPNRTYHRGPGRGRETRDESGPLASSAR